MSLRVAKPKPLEPDDSITHDTHDLKMLRSLLLLLILFLARPATAAETIRFWLAPELESHQREVWRGLKMWQDVCGVQFVRETRKESFARISINRRDGMTQAGMYQATNVYINTTHPYLHNTVAHEVGHWILGPSHSDNPSDIMYYQINARQRISRTEAARAVERFGERE